MIKGNTAGLVLKRFEDDGTFANSRLPLLLYREALSPDAVDPEAMEALFEQDGWPPRWRSSVFTYHHYHSTAHEVLGIASGEATLMLGGPNGGEFDVAAGDVIVIPAGVVHRRLSSSADFLVVGGYPLGQDWDLLRGAPGDRPMADENIAKVPMPTSDPVGGLDGPLVSEWRK
jgi:uncharacterized protein YjlB